MKTPAVPVILSIVVGVALAVPAHAKLRGETVEYHDGADLLEGYLAYDDAVAERRPGVLVVHDWMGVTGETKRRADMVAGLGYVAFAADIYGKGIRPKDITEASAQAGRWKGDRAALRRRVRAAFDVLAADRRADASRLASIGYCFGGTTVLELARSGAPVAGTASFHGGLDSPTPADAKNIKGRVLVLHGADDPFVPPRQVQAFEQEMREGGVDWQLVAYGGAVHAFTIRGAGSDNSKGAAYSERSDRRSWEAMRQYFSELFIDQLGPATAEVRGSIDKESIRRVIRAHVDEVKTCYEAELAKNPSLYGRVMIKFTINRAGSVSESLVESSTMSCPPVEQCIADHVKTWRFPSPNGGGVVIVSYPFVLKSE